MRTKEQVKSGRQEIDRERERERERERKRQRDAHTEKVWGLLYESFGRKPG